MGILIVGGYVVMLAGCAVVLMLMRPTSPPETSWQQNIEEAEASIDRIAAAQADARAQEVRARQSEIDFLRAQVLELTLQLATARGDLARQLELVLNPPAPEADMSPAPPADHVPDPSEAMTEADTADWTDEWFKGGLEDGVVPPPPEELGGL